MYPNDNDMLSRVVSKEALRELCKRASNSREGFTVEYTGRRAVLSYSRKTDTGIRTFICRMPLLPPETGLHRLAVLMFVSWEGFSNDAELDECKNAIQRKIFAAARLVLVDDAFQSEREVYERILSGSAPISGCALHPDIRQELQSRVERLRLAGM